MKNISAQEHFGHAITVQDLVKDYKVNKETGEISCFGGKLNPKPSYQREFVYNTKEQTKVFETLLKGFPLGIMYWCDNGDGSYELIDGQQRTLSICNIINNEIQVNGIGNEMKYFDDLTEEEKRNILNQKLLIYVCSGEPKEKMQWFETINIAGKALTRQELLSASYNGPFIQDARLYFVQKAESNSLSNFYADFVNNATKRQELLETVLLWKADQEQLKDVQDYLRKHQYDETATELWNYYVEVLNWARNTFGNEFKKEQRKVQWGLLFNKYHTQYHNSIELKQKVKSLMGDGDITKKENIYEYLLSNQEKILHIRTFSDNDKTTKYAQQNCQCLDCGEEFELNKLEAHHIVSWRNGGKTDISNLAMLCTECHKKRHND